MSHAGSRCIGAHENTQGDEIHICDAVLKSAGDECRDGEENGENLVGHVAPSHRKPYGQTDKHVTEYSFEKCFRKWEGAFSSRDTHGRFTNDAPAQAWIPGEHYHH